MDNNSIEEFYTTIFGVVNPEGEYFDDMDEMKSLGKDFLHYRVHKVKIFFEDIKGSHIVNGIQFFYRNIDGSETFSCGEHKGQNKKIYGFEEMILTGGEFLTGFHIQTDPFGDGINRIGFITNKRKEIKWYGDREGEDMEVELEGKNPMIFAPAGNIGKERMGAILMYYFSSSEFFRKTTEGYFQLKKLVKNKNKWEEKKKGIVLDKNKEILVRVCNLPDSIFNCIMKYCI